MSGLGMCRRRLLLAVLAAGVLAASLPAEASAEFSTQAAAQEAYDRLEADFRIAPSWTGSAESCAVGENSPAFLDATEDVINIFREWAGVEPITLVASKNHRALAAAMLMTANGKASHTPDPSWKCYSDEAAHGAGTSNLVYGGGGPGMASALVGDELTTGIGHRRWILDPAAMTFGAGSTPGSFAMAVTDGSDDFSRAQALPRDELVTWPPAGWIPWQQLTSVPSVSLGNFESQSQVEFVNPQVTMMLNGTTPIPVSGVGAHEPWYGTGKVLAWNADYPQDMYNATKPSRIDVNVEGATLDGTAVPITYTIETFDGDAARFAESPECEKARRILGNAVRNYHFLKHHGASRRKLRKARNRMRRAQRDVTVACRARYSKASLSVPQVPQP